MYSRFAMMAAGILTIIAAWLPWIKFMDITQNGFMGDYQGNPGIIFIAMGVIILVMGLLNKKWSAIVAVLIALCVCGLGFKYYNDATTGDAAAVGASAGYGLYCMIIAGLLGVAGGIMRFTSRKNIAVA